MKHARGAGTLSLAIGALGVVFGDIGTSPLYAFKESLHAVHGLPMVPANILGILSCIFWALALVVSVKYLAVVMKADNRGEGGIFALLALLPVRTTPAGGRRIGGLALLGILGASLLYGDGVITPAISVLSAVEGLSIATPTFQPWVVPITCAILLGVFLVQRLGTAGIGRLFGPVMTVWFVVIAALGIWHITKNPSVLRALSPTYAFAFFRDNGAHGFLVLGSVFLAVTGGEALYADMGHFGRKPIRDVWLALVKPALVLSYLGQGALLLRDPAAAANPFFALVPRGPATIALVVLSGAATVIASQALISGAFSLTRQAVELGYFPRLAIRHTSSATQGQIYVPLVNWALAISCIAIVLVFRESSKLAAAYGVAVTGTMAITSITFYAVTRQTWRWSLQKALPLLILFLAIDLPFLGANLLKFLQGGFVPVLLAALLMVVMLIWKRGGSLVGAYHAQLPDPQALLPNTLSAALARTPGVVVFLAHKPAGVSAMLMHYVSRVKALHETVVLFSVETEGAPQVEPGRRIEVEALGRGTFAVKGRHGFMEEADVPAMLEAAVRSQDLPIRLDDVTYVLGRESYLATQRGRMGPVSESIYAFLSRNATPADRHFNIPPDKVMELGTQLDL